MNNWNNQLRDGHVYQQPELDSIFPTSGAGFDNYIPSFHPISMPLTMQTSLLPESGGNSQAIAYSPNNIAASLSDITTSSLDPSGLSAFQQPDAPRARGRMIYTQSQIEKLETAYRTSEKYGYPSKQIKSDLAKSFGCTEAQINTWFSRRRGKDTQVKGKAEYAGVFGDTEPHSGTNTPEPAPLSLTIDGGDLTTSQSVENQEWPPFSPSIDSKTFESAINVTDPTLAMIQSNEPINQSTPSLNDSQPNNDWPSMIEVTPAKADSLSIIEPSSMNFSNDFELDYPADIPKDNESDMYDFLAGIETLEAQRHSHGSIDVNAFDTAFQDITNASYDITLPPGNSHASNIIQDWTSMVPASDIHNIPDSVNIFSDPENFEIAAVQSDNAMANSSIHTDGESAKSDTSILPSEPEIEVKDINDDMKKDLGDDPFLGISVFKPLTTSTGSSSSVVGTKAVTSSPAQKLESLGDGVSFSPFTSQQLHSVTSADIEKLASITSNVPISIPPNWTGLNLLTNKVNESFPNYHNLARTLLSQSNVDSVNQPGEITVRPKCVVEVIVPPPRDDLPIDNDPAKEGEEQTTPKKENVDELMHLLTPLVNKDWGLGHVDHIPKFVKFMRSEEQLMHRSLLLTVLVNTTDRSILKSFANSKGPTILRMWIVQAQKENNPLLIKLLEVLKKVPMDIDTLKETMLGRVIKTLKNSELEDVKKLATELMDRWTKLIQQEASAPQLKKRSREGSERTEVEASKSDTDLAKEEARKKARPEKAATSDTVLGSKSVVTGTGNKTKQPGPAKTTGPARQEKSTTPNAMAVANVDFFNELSASSLPKISKVRANTTSKLGTQPSSKPKNNAFSPLDALLPKILSKDGNNLKRGNLDSRDSERKSKTSRAGVESIITDVHPSTRPDTESVLKPGTKKKRVSFAPDHSLVQIREFKTEVEEPSMTVTRDWENPKPILFEFEVPQRGKDSNEASIQQAREVGVLSALYFSESQIPDTPNEPDEDVREDPTHQTKVIPLYDVGSETFQLSQLLSQVQATAPILAPLPSGASNLDPNVPSGPSWEHEPNSWQTEPAHPQSWPQQSDRDQWDSRQDPPYNPDNPGPEIPIPGQASNYTSNDPLKPVYHPGAGEEQEYDPYQDYPQDSREEYDPSYQPYGNEYEGYNEFDNGEPWDYNSGYEEGDRRWRFGAARNQYGRGRGRGGRGRGGPNRNGNRWGAVGAVRDGPGPNPRVGTAPCKFFAEGSCRYGDKCRFSHDFGRGR